jgi:hypothetical protein
MVPTSSSRGKVRGGRIGYRGEQYAGRLAVEHEALLIDPFCNHQMLPAGTTPRTGSRRFHDFNCPYRAPQD